jgi:hypothetical protein
MSTKTIRKRIAVVAVSALTAGVFSVVSTPVANATAVGDDRLCVAITNSATGSPVTTAAGGDTSLDRSVGFVALTSTTGSTVETNSRCLTAAGEIGTINALPTSKITFSTGTSASNTNLMAMQITGGTIVQQGTDTGTTALTIGANADSAVGTADDGYAIAVQPNAGVTSYTVALYQGANVTAAAPTNGTLLGQWVVTIVSASVSGVLSVADSSVYIAANKDRGTVCATAPTFDNLARNDDRKVACIYVSLVDAYGVALGAKTVSASATNGAKVEVGSAASDAYTASASFDSGSITATGFISVIQPTLGTAASSVVTVSVDGVVLGTKTINWNGIAASIELDTANSVSTFLASGAAAGTVPAGSLKGIVYRIKDAAGNIVTFAAQPTVADATGSMIAAQLENASGASTEQVVQSISAGKGTSTMYIANSAVTGDGTYKLSITNSAGTVIKSPAYNAKVVGSVATFTASWDKASYTPGEIATLTIKGLDSAGRPAADGTLLGTGTVISVNTDGFGHLTSTCETTPATSSAFLGGQKTCKFAVKNTPGSYSYSVKVATSTSQAETAGTLNVVASSATVSNADVLKSIVALIASINKQIQALQKLILRR